MSLILVDKKIASQSIETRHADAASSGSDEAIRWSKVTQARRKLQRGDYDDPAVLEAAMDMLLQSIK